MNIKAMKKAADALAEMKPTKNLRKFDMSTWGYKTNCGTTACAAGWLLILGKLPGYKPHFSIMGDLYAAKKGTYYSVPFAASAALGLNDSEAIAIFHGDQSRPKEVAEVMREMIAEEKSDAR